MLVSSVAAVIAVAALIGSASAQVHYHEDGRPWKNRARSGPDAEVEGWFYNLGITGLRVRLLPDAPTHLLVEHVFAKTPAARKVRRGDVLIGVAGRPFRTAHRNGYGMDVFGPHGPILEFADALEAAQANEADGSLAVTLLRADKEKQVTLRVGRRYGAYGADFPANCDKSEKILDELLAYLLEQQGGNGSWGKPHHDTFAALALLSRGTKRDLAAVERNVAFHARTTSSEDASSLINWRYMAAAIVLSEFYLATRERWVLGELEEIRDFLSWSQYTDLAQVSERVKQTHPRSFPKSAAEQHGGWGHNPGFEGYGPIAMITGQGALAFALMHHCGVAVDLEKHEAAYAFLARATGENGYVWYEDQVPNDDKWADPGRTGAAGLANSLSPYQDDVYRERALVHARVIGQHPESFPDTHGSPIMGMGYAAAAAHVDPDSFRKLMDANRWWFTLSQCADGTFYYQPNRDNAGYGADSRLSASAVTAFIYSIPKRKLRLTGRSAETR